MKLTVWLNLLVSSVSLLPLVLSAQELNLSTVQQQARENYPAVKQKDLIRQTADLTIQNLNIAFLPQLALNGQATYQSEVTAINIPLPGISVNPLSKDQYKATADVNQVLYDGGLISGQKQLQRLNAQVEGEKMK
jgi:hypothetical protein